MILKFTERVRWYFNSVWYTISASVAPRLIQMSLHSIAISLSFNFKQSVVNAYPNAEVNENYIEGMLVPLNGLYTTRGIVSSVVQVWSTRVKAITTVLQTADVARRSEVITIAVNRNLILFHYLIISILSDDRAFSRTNHSQGQIILKSNHKPFIWIRNK